MSNKKNHWVFLFTLLLISYKLAVCQDGINYLNIQRDVNRISCRFNVDTLYLTMQRLYILKDVKIGQGLAEYYYDCGVALHIYSIINNNRLASLTSNEYFVKCIQNSSKYKGDAYFYMTVNYSFLNDIEKMQKCLKLYLKHTPEEFLDHDFIKMINKKLSKS
ncbi:MAG: hypothetical protein BWY70_00257 [Bacteroidetes bacterium ADurb.Bin408]|nr:MAG: hypothetical protein BWY70_00257 [Bacteroidetes bacterium ADurb.Bin408]